MNELINTPSFFYKIGNFIKLCNPKPHSKNLMWDIFHIYTIYFISNTLLPEFLGPYSKINLLTPWLVVGFITQSIGKSYIQLLIASLLLEYSSSLPAGYYLIAYFSVATVIIQARAILSWRVATPWAVSFVAAASWLFSLNLLICYFFAENNHFSAGLFLRGLLNIFACFILGMWWREDWKNFSPKE